LLHAFHAHRYEAIPCAKTYSLALDVAP